MPTILVKNVEITERTNKAGKPYSQAEIVYSDNGKTQAKKIMSFANPAVYKVVAAAKSGESYETTLVKDADDFWQWSAIKPVDEAANSSPAAPRSNTTSSIPTRSTYETAEERAVKQRLIVRQSSLAQAVTIAGVGEQNVEHIVAIAEKLVAWVYEAPGLMGMSEDIPA